MGITVAINDTDSIMTMTIDCESTDYTHSHSDSELLS